MAQGKGNQMSEERMGEIALMYVRRKIREEHVPMNAQEILRKAGNSAKELGLPVEEVKEFLSILMFDAFNEVIEALDKK